MEFHKITMRFSDIPGHDEIKTRLVKTVKEGRVSHAQLFTGSEGCGGLALAIAYAQYISCENKQEEDSCGVCRSCHKYSMLSHPDFHFVFPVVKTKKFDEPVSDNFIDKWRELVNISPFFSFYDWNQYLEVGNSQSVINRWEASSILKKLSLKSFESDYKIMIIWLPEKMNITAANKLLKLIEEPPEKTLFLLVSDEPDKLLTTILSRCQLMKIPGFKEVDIQHYLEQKYGIDKGKSKELAHISNGNMNRAIELASSTGETIAENLQRFISIMRLAYSRDIIGVMKWAEDVAVLGRETQKSFLLYTLRLLRENMMLTLKQENNNLVYLSNDEASFSNKFHPFINEKNIFALTDEVNLAYSHVEANGNAKIIFLDLGLRIVKLIR